MVPDSEKPQRQCAAEEVEVDLEMSHLSFSQAWGTGFGEFGAERSRTFSVPVTRCKPTCKRAPLLVTGFPLPRGGAWGLMSSAILHKGQDKKGLEPTHKELKLDRRKNLLVRRPGD